MKVIILLFWASVLLSGAMLTWALTRITQVWRQIVVRFDAWRLGQLTDATSADGMK